MFGGLKVYAPITKYWLFYCLVSRLQNSLLISIYIFNLIVLHMTSKCLLVLVANFRCNFKKWPSFIQNVIFVLSISNESKRAKTSYGKLYFTPCIIQWLSPLNRWHYNLIITEPLSIHPIHLYSRYHTPIKSCYHTPIKSRYLTLTEPLVLTPIISLPLSRWC